MSTTRTITVYATKGQRTAKIETTATTWGELRNEVEAKGYDLEKLAATESVNRTTLENYEATLPEGNFTLFLRPVETKSGSLDLDFDPEERSWKQLREFIFKAMEQDVTAKDHFNSHESGKNYTQLSTPELRGMVVSYLEIQEEEEIEEEEMEEEEYEEEEYEEEEEDEEEDEEDMPQGRGNVHQLSNPDKVRKAKELLIQVCEDTENNDACDRINEVNDILDGVLGDIDTEHSEVQRLAQEAADLERGFRR